MAEPLVAQFGADVAATLADQLAQVAPGFDTGGFLAAANAGFSSLPLMARGEHLAAALQRFLPADYPTAVQTLLATLMLPHGRQGSLASFFYLPHTAFVARFGQDHVATSLDALHTLTQQFTGEFALRPFLAHHREATLERLQQWASDSNEHVRRLVSEGSRPRLPWATRVAWLLRDPAPGLALLERLRDDPSEYVRRSVANHLNDIGKDHPEYLIEVAERWWPGAGSERQALLRHALRYRIKQGDPRALALLGYAATRQVVIVDAGLLPPYLALGETLTIACRLHNRGTSAQDLLLDLRVYYCKADGKPRPKTFSWSRRRLGAGESLLLQRRLSTQDLSTRRHYPGRHRVELLVNGEAFALGDFDLHAGNRPPEANVTPQDTHDPAQHGRGRGRQRAS